MSSRNLSSYISGGIARSNPIENTPEFEAALVGQRIVPDTWGGYATRLMDLHDLEPHEAKTMLGITSADIADPAILFEQTPGYYNQDPESYFINRFKDEAAADLEVEVGRLRNIVDVIRSGYVLPDPDAAKAEAISIQDQIDQDINRQGVDILCTRRDALLSGVSIPLDEFVEVTLGCNVLDEENPSELAPEWIQGAKYAIEETLGYDFNDFEPDTQISEIVLGDDAFQTMKTSIDSWRAARKRAEERWDEIAPVFTARRLEDFPLISGNES